MGHCKGSVERKLQRNTGYLKKIETFQINNLILHLQEWEQPQKRKPRESRRKEMNKIRAELNDIETKRTIQRINKSKNWFFEKINKIDKPLKYSQFNKCNASHKEKKKQKSYAHINRHRKTFNKVEHPFMIKTLSKVGI